MQNETLIDRIIVDHSRARLEGEPTARMRPQPRRPDFLMESLQKEGLWSPDAHQHGPRYCKQNL